MLALMLSLEVAMAAMAIRLGRKSREASLYMVGQRLISDVGIYHALK